MVSTTQSTNFAVISFLVIVIAIEFICHLVSCFPSIGDIILSRKLLGNRP